MNNLSKKLMIYSLVTIMQVSLSVAVIEAAPLFNGGTPQIVQLDNHDDQIRQENDRHNREMRRHDGENDRDWHDRQDRENERHNSFRNQY